MNKDLIKLPIQLMVLNAMLIFKDSSLKDFTTGKIIEVKFLIIFNLVFLIVSFILEMFINPIHLEILQKNKKFGTDVTFFSIDSLGNPSREPDRTIIFTVKVKRNLSVWGLIITGCLILFKPKLFILPSSQGLALNVKNGSARSDLDEETFGIKIDLYQYMSHILSYLSRGEVEKNLEYIPNSDCIHYISSEKIIINTKFSKNLFKNFFYSLFFRIKTNTSHTIYFDRS